MTSTNDLLSPEPDRQWTDLSCHTPETAAAVFQYLNDEIAQQEERPNIEAHVEKATVRISYIDCRDREAWDTQFVGYRDGVESAAAHAAALQAQLEAIARERREGLCLDKVAEVAVEAFRRRAVAAVRALFHNSEVESARWNQAITEAVAKLQQLSTSTEDGE